MKKVNTSIAVIDLGTNTFHLLIARIVKAGDFEEIYRERRFIKLAQDGIETIGSAPWKRGIQAMETFATQLKLHEVDRVRALGTAALRTATNGLDFVRQVLESTSIQIELIDGNEEARLIHLGASLAIPFDHMPRLIMDIGGGSVEFIIADAYRVHWAKSFPVGVAILFNQYYNTDPLSSTQIETLYAILAKTIEPLARALEEHAVTELIGASGTFDVLEQYLGEFDPQCNCTVLPTEEYEKFQLQLLQMPLADRLAMERMPATRAEMLPVALILINVVIKLAGIHRVLVSPYALKEGVLAEMIRD